MPEFSHLFQHLLPPTFQKKQIPLIHLAFQYGTQRALRDTAQRDSLKRCILKLSYIKALSLAVYLNYFKEEVKNSMFISNS